MRKKVLLVLQACSSITCKFHASEPALCRIRRVLVFCCGAAYIAFRHTRKGIAMSLGVLLFDWHSSFHISQ